MGKLTTQLKTSKQALTKALKNRNEYEERLAAVRADKSMAAIERDEEAQVIKSFIEVYEEDAEKARKDLSDAETKMNDWLDTTVTQFDDDSETLYKEIDALQKLSDELNQRVNSVASKLQEMGAREYSIKYLSELFSNEDKIHWQEVANRMNVTLTHLRKNNAKAANVQIKTLW